jgi:hypothetical protein
MEYDDLIDPVDELRFNEAWITASTACRASS